MEAEAPTADAPTADELTADDVAAGALTGDERTQGAKSARLTTRQKLLSALALLVLAAILLLTFAAYLTPAMLFDFGTLQLCS